MAVEQEGVTLQTHTITITPQRSAIIKMAMRAEIRPDRHDFYQEKVILRGQVWMPVPQSKKHSKSYPRKPRGQCQTNPSRAMLDLLQKQAGQCTGPEQEYGLAHPSMLL